MRLVLLATAMLIGAMHAPLCDARVQAPGDVKFWIFLSDKRETSGRKTLPEDGYVSDQALRRRSLRGDRSRAESLDAPVSQDYIRLLQQMGIEPLIRSRWLNAVSAYVPDSLRSSIASLGFVRGMRPVGSARSDAASTLLLRPPAPPVPGSAEAAEAYPLFAEYGASAAQLELVSAVPLIEAGINGAGTRLGFLDTEFGDFQHPVFDRLLADGRLIEMRNFAQGPQANRHGLSVASVAVGYLEGSLVGPAFGAEVLAATTEYDPSETNQEEDQFVAGLEWLEARGADVVNVSLGYTEFDAGQVSYKPADMDGDTAISTTAADRAVSLGVVIVASAGNDGCDSPNDCWYFVGAPADGDSVITVGGVGPTGQRVSFSSRGPTADGRTKPDVAALAAPVYLAAPGPTLGLSLGTSFSSPMVAAIACQLLQVNPRLTPAEVRYVLRSTASQSASPDNDLGWGIVNASAAAAVAQQIHADDSPGRGSLVSVYPNPASDYVVFLINPPTDPVDAAVTIFDSLGRVVARPFVGTLQPSDVVIRWQPDGLASGIYLYRARIGSRTDAGSIVVI